MSTGCFALGNVGVALLLACLACTKKHARDNSDIDGYLSARTFRASKITSFVATLNDANAEKCEIAQGATVVLVGPPRLVTETMYKATLQNPLPDCSLREGYLHMPDFPMNWETPELPADAFESTRPYLRFTKTEQRDENGLYILNLELVAPGGKVLDKVLGSSGAPKKQQFRLWKDSVSNTGEPTPEGEWVLDPGYSHNGLEFANVWKDFESRFKVDNKGNVMEALGPVFGPIYYRYLKRDLSTHVNGLYRNEVGIHLDAGAPGTSGCVGIRSLPEIKRVVDWFEDANKAPRRLFVDWNLGTKFDYPAAVLGTGPETPTVPSTIPSPGPNAAEKFPKWCVVSSSDGEANVRSKPVYGDNVVIVLKNGASVKASSRSGSFFGVEFVLGGVNYGADVHPAFVHESVVTCK